jgi:hypothetical protein
METLVEILSIGMLDLAAIARLISQPEQKRLWDVGARFERGLGAWLSRCFVDNLSLALLEITGLFDMECDKILVVGVRLKQGNGRHFLGNGMGCKASGFEVMDISWFS